MSGVHIFALDYDAIHAATYALTVSAEGDCYLCVPPDPSIEATALGASEASLPGSALVEFLHTFTLGSGASCYFFRDSTTLTPVHAPVPVRLADASRGPVLARSSTVLPCLAVPSSSLSGLHLPSFSTNLVSNAALQDAMVTTTTPRGQRVSICMCTRTGRHLATFTRRPRSSLYTMTTEPSQVAASAQVSASGPVAASCSCRLLLHQTLLWHHRLDHPSLPRLRGMHSRLLVSGLPKSLPPLPPSPALPCLPCVEGRQHTAPHSSSFPPTSAPLQTLQMDPRVSLPQTSPTLRWTGKVGNASVFWVWGARAFVRDTYVDKLSSSAILYVFLGFPPDAPGWQFYHPNLCRVLSSQDVTFDELVPFYPLFPYHTAPLTPLPATLPRFRSPSGAARGAASGSVASEGVAFGGAEPAIAEPGGAEPEGVEPGGAESEGAESSGAEHAGAEPWGSAAGGTGAGGAGAAGPGGAHTSGTGAAGAGGVGGARAGDPGTRGAGCGGAGAGGGTGGAGATCPRGPRTRGTGAAGAGGVGGAGAGDPGAGGTGAGGARSGGARAGGAGAGDPGGGGTGPRGAGAGAGGTGAGAAGAGGAGAGGTGNGDPGPGGSGARGAGAGSPGARGTPDSPLPAPSPYAEQTNSLTEHREPDSRPASPVCVVCTGRRVPCPHPPPVPGTYIMTLRPSSVPLRVPLPSPPSSSLPDVPDPESDLARAANPTVPRLLATVVTDPSFESVAASVLVAELVDFAAACRFDYATSLVAESESDCPPPVGSECALSTDVLEDRRPVYGLRQAPREWHDTVRTTLAALGFAPSNADSSMFLRIDTSLPPFYVLAYINDLVFATAGTEALAFVNSEVQKRHTCTDLGELRNYLGLQITRDRARCTITLTQSHMVHQVLHRFGFRYSSPQSTPLLPPGHSL
ncbi:unnamed protein product [Closterium sp. NIES-54]